MTDMITRPSVATGRSRAASRGSVVLAGVLSALGAAALGLLCCLSIVVLGWATDPNSTGTSAGLVRAAGHLWLLAHRAPLVVGGTSVSIAPLGLTVLLFVFAARAGAGAARHTRARGRLEQLIAALFVVPPYVLSAAVVAAATSTADVRPALLPAAGCAFGVCVAGAAAGAARRVGWRELSRDWPLPLRVVPPAAAAATAVIIGTGAVLVAAALIADASRVTSIAQSIEEAAPAGLALLVVQLALAPNAAVWGSAYAAGTGFAVGVGTQIGPAGITVGAVPGLPILAALPAGGSAPAVAALSLAGVVAAGLVAGSLLGRHTTGPLHEPAILMVATAVVAAAIFALTCWLAGGAGPGRLARLGPDPLASGAAVAQWLVLSGVPAAVATSWRRGRRSGTAQANNAF